MTRNILIIGSAPSAMKARYWESHPFSEIVTINNAWQIRPDWTYNIFPSDFPIKKRPRAGENKRLITASNYVPAQNKFGGFVYGGGTMAFTAAYWALANLFPDNLFFLGCDMIYEGKNTHFYGQGTPDPLRDDITLRSLEAKSARFECFAYLNRCATFNLSEEKKSRLVYRRIKKADLLEKKISTPRPFNKTAFELAREREKLLGYFVEDGKYWKKLNLFDVTEIDALDKFWISCYPT